MATLTVTGARKRLYGLLDESNALSQPQKSGIFVMHPYGHYSTLQALKPAQAGIQ